MAEGAGFQDALDNFFGSVDDASIIEKKTRTFRSDKIINDLLKRLTSKRKLSSKDLDTVLLITIQKVVEAVQAQAITIYTLGDDNKIRFSQIFYSKSLYAKAVDEGNYRKKAEKLKTLQIDPGKGIVGKVIASGNPISSLVASKDPNFYNEIDKATGFKTESMITVPIKDDGAVLGAIQVLNKNPQSGDQFFSKRDKGLLEEVAEYSGKIMAKVQHPEKSPSETEIAQYVARLSGCEFIDLEEAGVPDQDQKRLFEEVGKETLKHHQVLPLKKLGVKSLKVAMDNPKDLVLKESFEQKSEMQIDIIMVAARSQINKRIKDFVAPGGKLGDAASAFENTFATSGGETDKTVNGDQDKESAPVVALANRIIEAAYTRGASDVHIEPFEFETLVRYRVDGVLEESLKLPKGAVRPLVARLKIMSNLDIAEHRLPQSGRIMFKTFTKTDIDVDLRVETAPMAWGEKVVMRLLDKTSTIMGLDVMGFNGHNMKIYREMIAKPYGMILHVGPTGSGKTTTLYAAINEINKPDVNISTAEDPVEYMLKGVNQMQMHKDIGLTFSTALRSFLRQDPDVILVGEIRDLETAEIAIESALTGHLLFSTLHTNDAPGTVIRFIDMGIEPFLVSSSLLIVCAQRLMRRLCKCKEKKDPTDEERETLEGALANVEEIADKPYKMYRPVGCEKCSKSGYKGRTGVHEVMTLNEDIQALIIKKVSTDVLKKEAVKAGMITLYQDALWKVKEGVSSLEEALSNVRAD